MQKYFSLNGKKIKNIRNKINEEGVSSVAKNFKFLSRRLSFVGIEFGYWNKIKTEESQTLLDNLNFLP